jgi:uncharacterized protein YkwD
MMKAATASSARGRGASGLRGGLAVAVCALGLALAPAAALAGPGHAARVRRHLVAGCAGAHAAISTTKRPAIQRTVVCLVNAQRRAHGLPALRENRRLNRSAQGWTNAMVSDGSFTHGSNFAARISAAGFHWGSAGESIATGYITPAAVVNAWMASTGHCQNILSPDYRYVGTGVRDASISGFNTLPGTWTQDFGLLLGQRAPSSNWGPANGCPYG